YTLDVLTPSVDAAAALAQRIGKLPEVAQIVTAMSYVPDDQPAKLAIIADAAQLIGPTLSPAQAKPPPGDAEILAALTQCRDELKKIAAKAGAAATRLATALDAVLGRGATVIPALNANLIAGIGHRLDDVRLALEAQPVTLASLPSELRNQWVAADGRA